MSTKFKRIIAFLIDWNISLLPFIFVFSFTALFLQQHSEADPIAFLLAFLFMILSFAAFILRDVIFKGRSLGKRILGLYVYDKTSLKKANAKQCFLRNMFLLIYYIDVIVLIATGKTIGDRVAGTLVMTKKAFADCLEKAPSEQPVSKKQKIKKVLKVLAIIIACLIAFIGFIQIILNIQKNSEEYRIAYNYLIESHAFKELKVDESKIRFNRYSSYRTSSNNSVIETAELGFTVDFKSFVVVCHKENSIWSICDECTVFE